MPSSEELGTRRCALQRVGLAAQPQASDEVTVTLNVVLAQVLQQTAAATDEQQQATTGVVVVLVGLQVLGQVVDALGQQCDLSLRGAGVGLVDAVLLEDFSLLLSGKSHECFSLFVSVRNLRIWPWEGLLRTTVVGFTAE